MDLYRIRRHDERGVCTVPLKKMIHGPTANLGIAISQELNAMALLNKEGNYSS